MSNTTQKQRGHIVEKTKDPALNINDAWKRLIAELCEDVDSAESRLSELIETLREEIAVCIYTERMTPVVHVEDIRAAIAKAEVK